MRVGGLAENFPGPEEGWVLQRPPPERIHVAFMSRGAADRFRKSPEMLGNKREQTATCCDMKMATPKVAELQVSL